VSRIRHPEDGRRVIVLLEDDGRELIERVFPRFNEHETKFTSRLGRTEQGELARLLRIVTATADDVPLVVDSRPKA
jgi:DNA-binding MarR family transcriptional regulator